MQMSTAVRALLFVAASSDAHPEVVAQLQQSKVSHAAAASSSKHNSVAKVAAHKPGVAALMSQAASVAHKVSTVEEARSALESAHKANKVWCGGMFADGCAACTQGNGESWCHGECAWADGQCAAKVVTTTAGRPRPSPTTTEGARPAEPVAASPDVKVLTQQSTHSSNVAPLASDGAAPAESTLHSVKFTPPSGMKLDPQWAAHLAAAPRAVQATVPQVQAAGALAPVHFEFAVPSAAAPEAPPTTTTTAQAVPRQPVIANTHPFAAWGDGAAASQAAAAAAAAAPKVAEPKAVAPELQAPKAPEQKMVKQTVKYVAPEPTAAPEPMVHHAADTSAYSAGHFLAGHKKEDECACAFHGDCTCEASMAFMECISSSCAEGCECHDMQYHDACMQLSDACSPVGLSFTCDKERAVCLDNSQPAAAPASTSAPTFQRSVTYGVKSLPEIQAPSGVDAITALYHSLNELKEDKCALELASSKGFVNADEHLVGVRQQIAQNQEQLADKCLKMPEMHCEKDFEEWSFPPAPCGEDAKEESSMFEGAPSMPKSKGRFAYAVSSLALAVAAFSAAASC